MYYLTSDATEVLWQIDPHATYIIGGIVDRNRFPLLAYKRAETLGIKTVRFPLDESGANVGHIHRHRILTTNKAVELLVEMALVDHHFHDNHVNEKNNTHSIERNTGLETIEKMNDDTTSVTVDKDQLCKKWRIAIDKVLLSQQPSSSPPSSSSSSSSSIHYPQTKKIKVDDE
jgi:hypothetical protein